MLPSFSIYRSWALAAFFYLTAAVSFGIILRFAFISGIDIHFQYILHTHSHIALLGWVNTGIMALIGYYFVTVVFFLIQVTLVGMLLFFPFQGYALPTITFSSLFLVISYVYLLLVIKDTCSIKTSLSVWALRIATFFFVVSSLGPWALAPINAMGLSGSNWYYLAIYFYLHFMYNGWFFFALIAIFFKHLESCESAMQWQKAKVFVILFFIGCFPVLFMSVLWTQPAAVYYFISAVGAILQLIGGFYFLQFINVNTSCLTKTGIRQSLLLRIVFWSFFVKLILQALSCFPYFADIAYQNRMFIIAYLHLVLIGVISFFLIDFFIITKFFTIKKWTSIFIKLLAFGFVLSETLMFFQGSAVSFFNTSTPNFYRILYIVSALAVIGIILLFIQQLIILFTQKTIDKTHKKV